LKRYENAETIYDFYTNAVHHQTPIYIDDIPEDLNLKISVDNELLYKIYKRENNIENEPNVINSFTPSNVGESTSHTYFPNNTQPDSDSDLSEEDGPSEMPKTDDTLSQAITEMIQNGELTKMLQNEKLTKMLHSLSQNTNVKEEIEIN
jgi:hypothetical protein